MESRHSVQSTSVSYGGIGEIQKDVPNSRKKKIGKKTDFRPIVPKIGIALNNSAEFENDINRI